MTLLICSYALIVLFYVCNFLVEALWTTFSTQLQNQSDGDTSYSLIIAFGTFHKLIRLIVITGMSLLLSSVCDPLLNRSEDPDAVLEDFMTYDIIEFNARDFAENGDIEMQNIASRFNVRKPAPMHELDMTKEIL